jgi:hypothetical protein
MPIVRVMPRNRPGRAARLVEVKLFQDGSREPTRGAMAPGRAPRLDRMAQPIRS